MTIAALKEGLRKEAQERRAALKPVVGELSRRLRDVFLQQIPVPSGATVSAYAAIGDEADPGPLLDALRARGHIIALPRVAGRGKPLDFHRYDAGQALVPGGFGLSEPGGDWTHIEPDILLVPLLAFDARGYRIGYGAGFYDRTLAKLRGERDVLAVGFAFAGQEFETVPHDQNDQRLDWVVTETGARKFKG
jgi:5-formyltetrahydrofolate cyclo-ligase